MKKITFNYESNNESNNTSNNTKTNIYFKICLFNIPTILFLIKFVTN